MTSQLTKAIQESDVATFNGYATHKQLDGYRDCPQANSIHGTGIGLKVRHTLTMKENIEPQNLWRSHSGNFTGRIHC